jgi:hypothetical protein
MILRIDTLDSGTVRVLGRESGSAADDRLGHLPEERGLYKKMKVGQLLRFYAALKGLDDSRKAVADWLERLGLGAWANHRVEALSEEMSQKVQFIAAVIDETGSVLPRLQEMAAVHNQFESFVRKSGKQIQPKYVIEAGPSGPVTDDTRLALSGRVRKEELFGFVELPGDLLTAPPGSASRNLVPCSERVSGERPARV